MNNLFVPITLIVLAWLAGLSFLFLRLRQSYEKLFRGNDNKDLLQVLNKLTKDFDLQDQQIKELVKAIEKTNKESFCHFQKVGLVRFNPFAGTGGDQSFCLALLDGEENGLVISSLHSRDTTRIYAKPVKKGKAAGYELSVEEVQAIKNSKKAHGK